MASHLPRVSFDSWLQSRAGSSKAPSEKVERGGDIWCPNGYVILEDGSYGPVCKGSEGVEGHK